MGDVAKFPSRGVYLDKSLEHALSFLKAEAFTAMKLKEAQFAIKDKPIRDCVAAAAKEGFSERLDNKKKLAIGVIEHWNAVNAHKGELGYDGVIFDREFEPNEDLPEELTPKEDLSADLDVSQADLSSRRNMLLRKQIFDNYVADDLLLLGSLIHAQTELQANPCAETRLQAAILVGANFDLLDDKKIQFDGFNPDSFIKTAVGAIDGLDLENNMPQPAKDKLSFPNPIKAVKDLAGVDTPRPQAALPFVIDPRIETEGIHRAA